MKAMFGGKKKDVIKGKKEDQKKNLKHASSM